MEALGEKGTEETPALTKVDKEPKEGVKTENEDDINLKPINETDTPAQVEMEDEDTINVFQPSLPKRNLEWCMCTNKLH
eukprot:bmy_20116T0